MERLSPRLLKGLQRSFLQIGLTADSKAPRFPSIKLELAEKGKPVDNPPAYFTKGWRQESWLLVGFRAFSQSALDSWREIFCKVGKQLPVYEVTVNERFLDRLFVWLQRKRLPHGHLLYTPQPGEALFADFLTVMQIESRLTAYVYFLDRAARVRWRAIGAPPTNALATIEGLLREYFDNVPRKQR